MCLWRTEPELSELGRDFSEGPRDAAGTNRSVED